MAVVQASVLQSFPFRAAVFALCVLLLLLFPSPQAPEGLAGGQALLAKAWELLHLLFVGIAVSYGLFSRRNDGGRRVDEKDAAPAAKPDARYVSQMLQDSLVFDDGGDNGMPDSPGLGAEDSKVRSWSALHHPDEPVVVVDPGGGGRTHAADAQQAPLSLPFRTLKPQPAQVDSNAGYTNGAEPRGRPRRSSQDSAGADDTVLPSPIPWQSRSGRPDTSRPASPSPSLPPRRLSPGLSLSKETLAKASEEYAKRRSPYKSSISSQPPAPPPPPPPPPSLLHGYHPSAERRTAAKSFKEELQDHSMRGRGDHFLQSSHSFNNSAYSSSSNSSAKPRSSFDGSSSSSSSVAKSVRTIRPREPVQIQSQELPDYAVDALGLHGSEEPYGYRAYQSIPRFQYERGSSDPILGKVTVSSDETESSDDDDDDDVGGYSTRTNSPRESTPEVDENEVDKKAEEFIARFREQIRLQRIESIKRSAGTRGRGASSTASSSLAAARR